MPVQCTVYTVQSVLSSGSNEPRTKTGFTAHPAIMLTCFFVLSLKWGLYTLPINGLWETRHLDISMRSLKSAGPRALPCGFPCVWTLGRHLELHVRSVRSLCQTDCRIGLASESQNKDAKTFTDGTYTGAQCYSSYIVQWDIRFQCGRLYYQHFCIAH